MGLFSGRTNTNLRDNTNPGGARHAADESVTANQDAIKALMSTGRRPGLSIYKGRHRADRY